MQVVEFIASRVWKMIAYQVWEVIAALALISFAVLLIYHLKRRQFDAISILFVMSMAIFLCAALLVLYPVGGIRQNIFLGPILFVASGYALHWMISQFIPPHTTYLAISLIVIIAIFGGVYTLTNTDPYRGRSDIKQALIVLESHRKEGDAVYVGSFAAPVVKFYIPPESNHFLWAACSGKYFTIERCGNDIYNATSFVQLYSHSILDAPLRKLFLLFHNDVPHQDVTQAFREFYQGDLELVSIIGSRLYVVENFHDIATDVAQSPQNNIMANLSYGIYSMYSSIIIH